MLFAFVARGDNGVVLILRDGTSAGFLFDQKPVLVTGATLDVKTDVKTVSYDYAAVQRAVFGDMVPSSVSLAKKNVDIAFKVTADGVVVLGLAKGERAQAYGIDGKKLCSGIAVDDQTPVVLPLPSGRVAVVVTSTGLSFKVRSK